jgi:hypothetical protein
MISLRLPAGRSAAKPSTHYYGPGRHWSSLKDFSLLKSNDGAKGRSQGASTTSSSRFFTLASGGTDFRRLTKTGHSLVGSGEEKNIIIISLPTLCTSFHPPRHLSKCNKCNRDNPLSPPSRGCYRGCLSYPALTRREDM